MSDRKVRAREDLAGILLISVTGGLVVVDCVVVVATLRRKQ